MYSHLSDLKKNNSLNIEEFKECLRAAWRAVPQSLIERLFDTMENRLRAVKKAQGWCTEY
ncbi:hypothetical protein B0H63DRAFT_477537 [Podospora didyma]|uniref:Uncharacterized protein n=1 Tax=Podospora didyma TaxID=330526 RepID=A0AAE0NBI2_9PEZI|nr:hypothetical protein B0H63DRAFT_477537 [Podospora didyma]